MVETIAPVVHGGSRARWAESVAFHALGTTASAALFGVALGSAGAALGAPWGASGPWLVAMFAALYLIRQTTGLAVPIPQGRRQVPAWWRTFFGPAPAALLYGLALGVGFLTYLSFGTLIVVAVAAAASGSPLVGMAVMAPFGIARGASVLAGARDPKSDGDEAVHRLAGFAATKVPMAANGIALAGVLAVAVAEAIGGRIEVRGPASAVVAIAFAWSAFAKGTRPREWRGVLRGYRLPAPIERTAILGVPLAEAAVAGLLLAGRKSMGAAGALVLLAAFSGTGTWAARRTGGRLACGCFGGAKVRDVRAILVRNLLLAIPAAAVLTEAGGPLPRTSLTAPIAKEAIPLLLFLFGAVVLASTLWRFRAAI